MDPHDLQLDDLHEGWQVGFGFMTQYGLSGRRFVVTELRRYRFGSDSYTAYTLEDSDYKVQLVPARDDEGIPYIAISRLVEISDLAQIVDTHSLNEAIEHESNKESSVSVHNIPRSLKGWVDTDYKRALKKIEGTVSSTGKDALFGGKSSAHSGARRIFYSLFVNDKGTHALEVEQFANGRKQVYATVYRPASDIGQIARPHHGVPVTSEQQDDVIPYVREVPLTLDDSSIVEKSEDEDRLIHIPPTLKGVKGSDVVAIEPGVVADDEDSAATVDVAEGQHEAVEEEKKEKEENNSVTADTDEVKEKDGEAEKASEKLPEDEQDKSQVEAKEDGKTGKDTKADKDRKPKKKSRKNVEAKKEEDAGDVTKKTTDGKSGATEKTEFVEFEKVETTDKAMEITATGSDNTEVETFVAAPLPVEAGKTGVILPQQPEAQMVNCNMRVAGKVIDEATRSGLTLTQVVRKVMDLPAELDETVQLRLRLTEQDRRELAKRYSVDADDPRAIAEVINRELQLFAGEDA